MDPIGDGAQTTRQKTTPIGRRHRRLTTGPPGSSSWWSRRSWSPAVFSSSIGSAIWCKFRPVPSRAGPIAHLSNRTIRAAGTLSIAATLFAKRPRIPAPDAPGHREWVRPRSAREPSRRRRPVAKDSPGCGQTVASLAGRSPRPRKPLP